MKPLRDAAPLRRSCAKRKLVPRAPALLFEHEVRAARMFSRTVELRERGGKCRLAGHLVVRLVFQLVHGAKHLTYF